MSRRLFMAVRRALALGVALWLGFQALAPSLAAASVAFTVQDKRITSPVGFALDATDYVFWTANSSDRQVVAYAVDYSGATQGRLSLGAEARGVASIAFAKNRVYIADFGDPGLAHKTVSVYVISPRLTTATVSYRSWDFEFPDNSYMPAALLVSSEGRLLVVAKGAAAAIYAAPASPVEGTNQLTRVASAPRDVTSATFLADGRIALRTAKSIVILDPATYQPVAQAAVSDSDGGPLVSPSASGTHLLLGDSGPGAALRTVNVPTALADLTPTPTPTPTPSVTVSPTAAPTGTTFNQNGTLIALAAAAGLAFLAGAVVLLRR